MAIEFVPLPPSESPENPFFPYREEEIDIEVSDADIAFPLDYIPSQLHALPAIATALPTHLPTHPSPNTAVAAPPGPPTTPAGIGFPYHGFLYHPDPLHPHGLHPAMLPQHEGGHPGPNFQYTPDTLEEVGAPVHGYHGPNVHNLPWHVVRDIGGDTPMDTQDDDDGDDMDDNASDISSNLTEIRSYEFPDYFEKFNGRLFHSHGTSLYPLPVDGPEWNRLDAIHILFRLLTGSNYDGPVAEILRNSPRPKVVDLCNGRGTWVMEMAKEFGHADFRGLDLVPIATQYPYDNVRFEIADVRERLRFADNSVDVVHARSTSLNTSEYEQVLREVARVLRPGGLFLSGEWGSYPALHPAHPQHATPEAHIPDTARFMQLLCDVLEDGRPLAPRIAGMIAATGAFTAPHERRRAVPLGAPYVPPAEAHLPARGLEFVGAVARGIAGAFADSLAVGCVRLRERRGAGTDGVEPHGVARAFMHEMETTAGIVGVWHTVWARKR